MTEKTSEVGEKTLQDIGRCDTADHGRILDAFSTLEARYRRIFDSTRDMSFTVSREGKLLEVNQAGAEIFGYGTKEEMMDLASVGYLFWNREDGVSLLRKIEREGFAKDYEVEMRRKNGTRFIACITANLWFDKSGRASCEGILRDVTELKLWQQAFIESEKHVRELTESEKNVRLLNQHILNMLMIMSHDIRGPLVAIAATLKLLIRGIYGNMDESVMNTLTDLMSRVVQLLGIAEDYLGRAQSVDGFCKFEREVLDLRQDIIDPVLDELSNDIQKRGIIIDNRLGAIPAGTIPVHANKIWLKAVFRNLFKNAVKYGGKGCRIAFGFEDHGSYYRLNVYNSGTPIPEEHRARLFTKFGRIESENRPVQDGVGLGLFLIKEIIGKHGGAIWYEARPDGSDFVFTIPKELS